MSFAPNQPFNELPLLPPTHDIESKQVLKKCITARAALAELNQAVAMLPNQTVLINTLPLLEAQASSEIENIVTTTDKLFQFSSINENQADPATKEALRYRTALREGFKSIQTRPLSTATAIQVCSLIKSREMDIRAIPGTTLTHQGTGATIYTPPIGKELLLDKLSNWENFIHNHEQLDPLIRMAMAHYQFEAIHPFSDGNGRTGRILNILFLIQAKLLNLPVLYLSRYILQHKADYYAGLRQVTEHQSWEAWIMYMLHAVETTATWTCHKVQAILKLMKTTRDFVENQHPQVYSHELIELLFTLPYCRINDLVAAGIAQRQTASYYLKILVSAGILEEVRVGRDKLFVNPRFLQLLLKESNHIPAMPSSTP